MTASIVASEGVQHLADLLCVDIGVERFALPLSSVEQMIDGTLAELGIGPGNRNRNMVGVLRVRHELLPVYEGARVLGVQRTGQEPMALIMQGRDSLLALLVDGADAASQVNLGDVRTPERIMAIDRALDGLVRVHGRWVGLINTSAFVELLEREHADVPREASHVN